MDIKALALAKKYTDDSIKGLSTIKGKNCIVKEYREAENEVIVTFQWTADDGAVQTTDVPISYEKIAELADVDAKAGFKTLELDIVTSDYGATYTAENLSATFGELKEYERSGLKLLAVGKLVDGAKICLNLLETSDTKLIFTGCVYQEHNGYELTQIYTIEMTETVTSAYVHYVPDIDDVFMLIDFVVTETDGVYSVLHVSHTFREIRQAVYDGVAVILAVAEIAEGVTVTLPLYKSSDTAYEFSGCGNKNGTMLGYSLTVTETEAMFAEMQCGGSGGSDVFVFTCDLNADDFTQPPTNISATFEEINAAIEANKEVVCIGAMQGIGNLYFHSSMYLNGNMVSFNTTHPDSGKAITLLITADGQAFIEVESEEKKPTKYVYARLYNTDGVETVVTHTPFAEIGNYLSDYTVVVLSLQMSDDYRDCIYLSPAKKDNSEIIFTGSQMADNDALKVYTVSINDAEEIKWSVTSIDVSGGSEAFTFTFTFKPNGIENPISNLSATYDEIKAAIDGEMTVYGVGNAYGHTYMQFIPAVWDDEILVFSAANPDGGLPYLLTIDSSGNGVVRTEELEENVFSFGVDTHIEDGTRFIDLHGSYDDINNAFGGMKSVVCKLNVLEQDGTTYYVSLYMQSRVDGTIVFSGKAAPHGVENEYTLTIKYTGEKTLDIKEADEKLKEAVKTANNYTDEQIEKLSTAEALSVDEKPLYEDGKITYVKDGVTHTLEDVDTWFYYRDADGALFQTIWIDGTEHTIKAGNVDLTEYLKKTSVVMPKENISDPDPEYKAEDVPSMALLEKLLAENGGSGGGGGNPVGTVIAFSGLIPPKGYLLCDGAEVSRTEYKDLFSIIGELYGAGDGSTTFNLPNLTDRFVQGIGANTLGATMEAGLPNINAKFDAVNLKGSSNSGAVYTSRRDDGAAKDGSGAGFGEDTYYFNASRSNAIYGKSNTVQPPAVVMTYIIRAVAGEAVDNDYVAGEGIAINPTVVDGEEKLEISSVKQELTITGQLRGSSEIVSLDKTFAEIKAAIEAEKNVTLYIFEEGSTENPYVFTPSVILADTINFSLVYGMAAIDIFMLMSVDINSDDTYTVNSRLMQKELVAGDGIELKPKTVDGKDVLEINSTKQELTITGQLRDNNKIVSLDQTFAEIKAAIEAKKNVTLFMFTEGETENPYVFTPSVVLADTINFSLVNGTGAIDTFEFMSVDIHSDNTYTVNSKIMQKEFVAGDGVKIKPKTIEEESEFGETTTRETLEISSDSIIESPLELPVDAKPNKLYHTYANYDTSEFGALINGEFRRYSGFTTVQTLPTTDIIETNVYLIPGNSWNIYSPTEGKWYTYVYSSAIEVLDFSEIEEPADNTLYRLLKRVHTNKMYKLVDGAWLGYEPEFFPAGTLKMVDNVTVHDPDLNIDKTSRQLKGFSVERRDSMPTGSADDPIEKNILYVDVTNGSTDEEAALLKRYEPNLSKAADGYLRYLPVDGFIKTFDPLALLSGLTASSPLPQGFVIADSLLYLQGYFKSSQTFSSVGWHSICEFDLEDIGYEWAGLSEGQPIRILITVWLDGAYVNSCISAYHLTGSPSQGRLSFYVTNALVNKAIAFNMNVLLPVRKKR